MKSYNPRYMIEWIEEGVNRIDVVSRKELREFKAQGINYTILKVVV